MKKSKRYVRICAALLCAVLCLSVNVAPAMAAKVKGCRRIIISQENLKLLGTKYSYNEYEKFFEDALAPISISKEQLLNMPESVEQEKEPESDSAEGQQQEDIINNNEPQYDGGFDFGDDFYQ